MQALQVCEHYQRYEEMVYLLGNHLCGGCRILVYVHIYITLAGRMGNQKRALKLIINELQDVDKVSTFLFQWYYRSGQGQPPMGILSTLPWMCHAPNCAQN